jgi:hypothetical protein
MSAFPSVKAMTYAVWHKFYANRDRKWDRGDAYDIIISSAIPYMDAVITENQMADGLARRSESMTSSKTWRFTH